MNSKEKKKFVRQWEGKKGWKQKKRFGWFFSHLIFNEFRLEKKKKKNLLQIKNKKKRLLHCSRKSIKNINKIT